MPGRKEMYSPVRKMFHEEMIALCIVVRGCDVERLIHVQLTDREQKKRRQTEKWSILLWGVELVDVGEGCAEGSSEWGPASLECRRTLAVVVGSRE